MVDEYGADDHADGVFHVWPAFVDLLAATSLLFISLVAAFIFVRSGLVSRRKSIGVSEGGNG